jgi:hypothetical protein
MAGSAADSSAAVSNLSASRYWVRMSAARPWLACSDASRLSREARAGPQAEIVAMMSSNPAMCHDGCASLLAHDATRRPLTPDAAADTGLHLVLIGAGHRIMRAARAPETPLSYETVTLTNHVSKFACRSVRFRLSWRDVEIASEIYPGRSAAPKLCASFAHEETSSPLPVGEAGKEEARALGSTLAIIEAVSRQVALRRAA